MPHLRTSLRRLRSRATRQAGTGEAAIERFARHLSFQDGAHFDKAIEIDAGITVPTLAEIVTELRAWPDATAFVEIKRESLDRFGVGRVVDRVLDELRPVLDNAVVISFDIGAVDLARHQGGARIGWVLEAWDDAVRADAGALGPEYLFCDMPLAGDPLWPGPWQWVVYGVETADDAMAMAARGADLVETMAVGELLAALEPRT